MPDEELGIAGRLFTIEYVAAGPEAFLSSNKDLDEEVVVERGASFLDGSRSASIRIIPRPSVPKKLPR